MDWGNALKEAQRKVQTRSDIHDPMRTALDDIVQTHERGEHALAEAKVRMLASKWTAFMDGDKAPEQFAPLVQAMTIAPLTPSTTPGTRPSGTIATELHDAEGVR